MRRPRGFGQTYQRHGRWWIRWYGGGVERRESVAKALRRSPEQVVTEKDALRLLKDRMTAKATGGVRPLEQERLTVGTLIDEYQRSRTLREGERRTEGQFRSQLEQLRDWFGDELAAQLNRRRIEAIAEAARTRGFLRRLPASNPEGHGRRREPYALSTIKQRLDLLHAVLAHAWRNETIPAVPAMPKIVIHNARRGLIERPQLDAILRHLQAPLDDLVRFGWFTGWRASECRDLTWEHFDLARGVVQYWPGETKTGEGRVRPIFEPELAELLERRRKARALGCRYVFHRNGQRLSEWTLNNAWRRARRAAGYPQAIFHDFRRTAYADLVGGAGVDLLTAMELIGHKSLRTAQRYNVVELTRMQGGLAKLAAYRATMAR